MAKNTQGIGPKKVSHLRKMFGYKPTKPILDVEDALEILGCDIQYLHEYVSRNRKYIKTVIYKAPDYWRLSALYLTEEGLKIVL